MSDPYTYDTLWSLVGFTSCIFLFFLVSLMIPNIPSQDHGEKNDKEEEGKKRNCCATVGPKAISIFVVLGQYRGCAALAIVGWYFFNAFGTGYVSLSASPPFWLLASLSDFTRLSFSVLNFVLLLLPDGKTPLGLGVYCVQPIPLCAFRYRRDRCGKILHFTLALALPVPFHRH